MPPKPIKPTMPEKSDKIQSLGCSLFIFVGSIALAVYLLSEGKWAAIFYSIPLIGLSYFFVLLSKMDWDLYKKETLFYKKKILEFPERLQEYEDAKREFEKRQEEYSKLKSAQQSPENVQEYRKKKMAGYLNSVIKPIFMPCDKAELVKKGASEQFFYEKAKQYFDNCLINQRVSVGGKFFYPDVVITEKGLCIDVEIDEPYAGSSGVPIHFVEKLYDKIASYSDSNRNHYFLDKGWIIIRFAEEQIFKDPTGCISCIKSVIAAVTQANLSMIENPSFIIPRWTKEDACQMAYKRYRHSYVPKNYQNAIAAEDYSI